MTADTEQKQELLNELNRQILFTIKSVPITDAWIGSMDFRKIEAYLTKAKELLLQLEKLQ